MTDPETFLHEVSETTARLREELGQSSVELKPAEFASVVVDPLESAIRDTVCMLQDHAVFLAESGLSEDQKAGVRFLGEKLNSHLNHLLAAQLDVVCKGSSQEYTSAAKRLLSKLLGEGRISISEARSALGPFIV
ncbi:hypothetical protein F9Z43_14975 [Pseudomonas monteilii]|uniref:Uncharacterized protein n=1 Tax=Pseudomonas monteilii TaxID=76759 RepID=A0A7X3F3J9_9PSED|nr:hypothetical protein [Pseudomonas monteilii]MVF50595.1 hypothetical protein [Pseudomonas monteilii]